MNSLRPSISSEKNSRVAHPAGSNPAQNESGIGHNVFPKLRLPRAQDLNFDIDLYLDPYIPKSRIDRLPRFISRFLGYRDAPRRPIGNLIVAAWSFLGGFAGTCLLAAFFMSSFIKSRGGPVVLGSYGAAAILEFNVIEAAFAQPRNSILSQVFASLIGVCITKLFELNSNFESLRWLAGALSVATASAFMTLTNTIYPPAGSIALLASIDNAIIGLGWLYIPIVFLSSIITLFLACLINNIQRQYPLYWWKASKETTKVKDDDEEESGLDSGTSPVVVDVIDVHDREEVVIQRHKIVVPATLHLSIEEKIVLQVLEARLRDNVANGDYL